MGLFDTYGREHDDLRISVTDQCNFRCNYCMPEEGMVWLPKEEILTFEEIARVVRITTDLGFDSYHLTGGEPLLRKELEEADLKAQLQANRPKYTPPKSEEELNAFKKDYPDIYGVVETVSHLQSQTEMKGMQEEVDSLKKANQALSQREAQLELSKHHPDFNSIKESDDFHNWADSQPMEIKSWIYENNSNGKLAARAVDLYKKDRGLGLDKKPQESKTITQGADLLVKTNEQIQPPTNNKIIFKSSDFDKMSDAEFEKREQEILTAQREGRVIND